MPKALHSGPPGGPLAIPPTVARGHALFGGIWGFFPFLEFFEILLAAPFVHVAPPFHIHAIPRIKGVNVCPGHFLATGYRFGATGP